MRIVLLGAPGSGKGTQAAHIAERYEVDHISTGDLLRAEVTLGSALGIQAKQIMDAGSLVSDEIMLGMIESRLTADATGGFLLDGFPRTLPQAEGLDALLKRISQPLDVVLFFDVDYAEIIQRLLARGRSDDTEEAIRTRLQVYENQTAPLIDFYKDQGNLRSARGDGDIAEISERLFALLDQVR